MIRLLNAMTFAREAQEDNFNTPALQCPVILFGLSNRDATILFAVRYHYRRFDFSNKSHRRKLPIGISCIPWEPNKPVFHQTGDIALAVKAVPVADACVAYCGFEPVCLSNCPEGHKATIASPHHHTFIS